VTDRRFTRFTVAVLAYNVAVVLFGAVVRATGSGAGCGADWPRCQGSFVPEGSETATFIEFTHRATSGIALLLVAVVVLWAVRNRQRGDAVRWMAIASGVLVVNEALIGAMLVLFEWVAEDESVGRVVSVVLHLVNTFLLLGALTLTAWFSAGRPIPRRPLDGPAWRLLRWGGVLLLVVSAMGAITALGDTLFPKEAVGTGFLDDLAGTLITRLRWVHPVIAVGTAGFLIWMLRRIELEAGARPDRSDPAVVGAVLERLVYLQVALGVVNVVLLAPVWMQIVHLLVADLVWIAFVLFATQTVAARRAVAA
jgi:cytochrome c oxidase assembly protein subunit 15